MAKRDLYARLGVREYWRHDPVGNLPVPLLVGERLVNGSYEPIDLRIDESGILRGYSDILKLDFCVVHSGVMPELRLFDPAAGEWLLSPKELAEARQLAQAQVKREAQARQFAESEVRELRELLARAGISPPSG